MNLTGEIKRISGTDASKCMRCGKCSAVCLSADQMDVRPHRFVKNAADGNIAALAASKTLWKCLSCFACVERCPRGVEPANLVEAVRLSVIRKQGGNHIKPDDIPAHIAEDSEIPQQLLASVFRKYSK